jgi:MraZ protein
VAFRGSFDFTLDAKNRLTIPVAFRGPFAEGVVLARLHDAENCVSVWRTADFDAHLASLLEGLHPLSEDHATLTRFYWANARDTELDAAGRVMVPANLIELTGLEKDVTVSGAGNRLEVRNRDTWRKVNDELERKSRQIRPAVGNTA